MFRSLLLALVASALPSLSASATPTADPAAPRLAGTQQAAESTAQEAPATDASAAEAPVDNPYPSVGIAEVDAAVEAYAAADAAWKDAADADKEAAATTRSEAKDAALAAIDGALEDAAEGSPERKALRSLRLEISGMEITGIEDVGAAVGKGREYLDQALAWVRTNWIGVAMKIVVILVIYMAFKALSGIVGGVVRKALNAPNIKATNLLKDFLIGIAKKIVMLIGLLVILGQLGVEVGPILAGLGVAGFVLGFALQDTLGNFAAGLMILFYRPFDVGDFVEAGGVTGSVDSLNLVSTTVVTPDNQRLIVPNSSIWGGVIRNVTAADTRRVDLVFGIGYGDDMAQAERVLSELVEADERCLKDPAPNIRVHELGDSSVNFIVRPWVKKSDYWDVYWDLTRKVKEAFDREGISIPFPQRDVHLYRADAADADA